MSEPARNFWQTVPGVITAVAALITALGGLLGVLIQNDVISLGSRPGQSSPVQPVASTAAEPTGQPTPSGTVKGSSAPTETGGLIPWDMATALLVRDDGTTTTVKAQTVSLACDTGTLKFENGQTVSLDLVDSVRFDTVYLETATADGEVTLLDGHSLTDPIYTWNCPITGTNELGTVSIDLNDIERIAFQR